MPVRERGEPARAPRHGTVQPPQCATHLLEEEGKLQAVPWDVVRVQEAVVLEAEPAGWVLLPVLSSQAAADRIGSISLWTCPILFVPSDPWPPSPSPL